MRIFINSAFCRLFMLMALMTVPAVFCEGSGKSARFFDSAVEEYLNENYESALKAVRKSIELDPKNKGVREFAIKLLLQMATNAHLKRRPEEAMKLLEEARAIDPDDEQVNKLSLLIRQEPGVHIPSKAAVEVLPGMGSRSLEARASRLRAKKAPPAPAAPAAQPPRKRAKKKTDISSAVKRTPPPALKADPKTTASQGPAAARTPLQPVIIFPWKIIALIFAFTLICIGAVFVHLKRIQRRLQQSLKSIREVEKMSREQEAQRREEMERMEKKSREQEAQRKEERDRMEREFREQESRRADMERQEHLGQEMQRETENASGRRERERFRLEDGQRKKFDRMIKKEDLSPEELEDARDIHEKILIIETSSLSREQAYKRLAARFKDIYELDREKAVDFIMPLLGDSNPNVRAYVAGGVSQLAVPESVNILFQLWDDPDIKVKAESLRGLHNFYKRPDFTRIFPEKLRLQIETLIKQEKRKGDWLL